MEEKKLNVQNVQNNQTDQIDPGANGKSTKKKNPARGFNNLVGDAELLAEAMTVNQELLAPGGGGEEFLNQLKEAISALKNFNLEQERYKASQKETTENIRLKLEEMTRLVRKGRRIIKNEVDQKRWVEFGISATM